MNELYLPVSIGEAIDKLTILDIKCDKIKDERKNDVKIEYDLLYAKLKDIIYKYPTYYNMMKYINLEIWDMMDILRDSNISEEKYLIKCKECIESNDIRFRIKNKINYVSNSLIKEQKGYNILKVVFNIKSYNISLKDICNIIRYCSFLYDNVIIICNINDIEYLQNYFNNDITINILFEYNGTFLKYINLSNKSINDIYNELNINDSTIQKYNTIYS